MSSITGYVGVVRMANHFAAMHFQGQISVFVSEHLESDIKVAQATAKAFADSKRLPYDPKMLYQADRPTYTVIKNGKKWYPAVIFPDCVKLLTDMKKDDVKFDISNENLEIVKGITQAIAEINKATFLPNIGISLNEAST